MKLEKRQLKVKKFLSKKRVEILQKKMNTSTGLVRRTNAAKSNSSEFNTSSTSPNNDHNDNFKNGSEDENIEETSDKETRLTLMEEVLLLGLKDKEVCIKKCLTENVKRDLASSMNRFANFNAQT